MTTFLVIRHGQSVSNIQGIFTGHLDLPLTELGQQQAQLTAQYIIKHYPVDRVYASDLRRAMDTAAAVAEPLGLSVTADARLREIHAGRWEGLSFDRLTREFAAYHTWRNDIGSCVTDGGESVAQLSRRVLEAFYAIAAENPGKTVAVATHATPIRALQCHCLGLPVSQMRTVPWTTNASVSILTFENDAFTIRKACLDDHLGAIVSRFPSNV